MAERNCHPNSIFQRPARILHRNAAVRTEVTIMMEHPRELKRGGAMTVAHPLDDLFYGSPRYHGDRHLTGGACCQVLSTPLAHTCFSRASRGLCRWRFELQSMVLLRNSTLGPPGPANGFLRLASSPLTSIWLAARDQAPHHENLCCECGQGRHIAAFFRAFLLTPIATRAFSLLHALVPRTFQHSRQARFKCRCSNTLADTFPMRIE